MRIPAGPGSRYERGAKRMKKLDDGEEHDGNGVFWKGHGRYMHELTAAVVT